MILRLRCTVQVNTGRYWIEYQACTGFGTWRRECLSRDCGWGWGSEELKNIETAESIYYSFLTFPGQFSVLYGV